MNASASTADLTINEIREAWPVLSAEERFEAFSLLDRESAQEFFMPLLARAKASLISQMTETDRTLWMRLLPLDDAADVIQVSHPKKRETLLSLLDDQSRQEVRALLLYKEDVAGGLMNPRFARVRPHLTVDEAIRYLRLQISDKQENIYYVYVLDESQKLLGVVSFRDIFKAPPHKLISDIMQDDVITVTENQDQEVVSRIFSQHKFLALPVVDRDRKMRGIITADDIMHVMQQEVTEDIHKLGGMEALKRPYMQIGFWHMLRKRAGWLVVLFFGEMLTASAMAYFEEEIARAVVLALFVPLIISSGGNSGSQATTLIIRAMALGEVKLRDWLRIAGREMGIGLGLGCILSVIGFFRIVAWQMFFHLYGEHYLLVALAVSLSLAGVVMWGTLAGSMLPLILRRLGFDPASASAPFVATLVDVSGIMIYFSASALILRGTLL
ncbi:MAG: magnesium transporter [Candidatus Omnitrophica bacterium CG11_big_fil_rev_8_21_14_0_20_45_26]|uniref:Magnesium transporter MgtE n=1 Tax=Candidatus Abzuiibacterium crystallinum TaxID=1974748 RepID=A0A2H0LPY1_9BACT|nr:MAG: magnesium transporter [Candidatus Omnitrophica bacterium CG11_big_fil_rev_8_21_14_0_20_45_26]PIW64192.1 MAG: magnesium transporter [Candidatus Omnitrophica bacterium CG12_big_fil_rev_8_21_14_0_65_45_16]